MPPSNDLSSNGIDNYNQTNKYGFLNNYPKANDYLSELNDQPSYPEWSGSNNQPYAYNASSSLIQKHLQTPLPSLVNTQQPANTQTAFNSNPAYNQQQQLVNYSDFVSNNQTFASTNSLFNQNLSSNDIDGSNQGLVQPSSQKGLTNSTYNNANLGYRTVQNNNFNSYGCNVQNSFTTDSAQPFYTQQPALNNATNLNYANGGYVNQAGYTYNQYAFNKDKEQQPKFNSTSNFSQFKPNAYGSQNNVSTSTPIVYQPAYSNIAPNMDFSSFDQSAELKNDLYLTNINKPKSNEFDVLNEASYRHMPYNNASIISNSSLDFGSSGLNLNAKVNAQNSLKSKSKAGQKNYLMSPNSQSSAMHSSSFMSSNEGEEDEEDEDDDEDEDEDEDDEYEDENGNIIPKKKELSAPWTQPGKFLFKSYL